MKRKRDIKIRRISIIIVSTMVILFGLIIAFSFIMVKSHYKADLKYVQELNYALTIDGVNHQTMASSIDVITKKGYNIDDIKHNKAKNYIIGYDIKNERFVLINDEKSECHYLVNDEIIIQKINNKYDYFVIYDETPTAFSQNYSIYLSDQVNITKIDVVVGIDVGNNQFVKSITYDRENETSKREVTIRTSGGELIVKGYTDGDDGDEINHYGESFSQYISCANSSFHEFGSSVTTTIHKGHYVQENNSLVSYLDINANLGDCLIDLKNGAIVGTITNNNDTNQVTINASKNAYTVNFKAKIDGGALIANFLNEPKYANIYDLNIQNENNNDVLISGLGTTFGKEDSLIPDESINCTLSHSFITIPNSSIKICNNCGQAEVTEKTNSENAIYQIKIGSDGKVEKTEVTINHEHIFSEPLWEFVNEKEAYAIFNCTVDECFYQEIVVALKENNDLSFKTIKEATCITDGLIEYQARVMHNGLEFKNDSMNQKTIDALGHDLIYFDEVLPTCTTVGHNAYEKCTRCDYSTYVEIPNLGHNFNSDGICERCHQSDLEFKFINHHEYLYRIGNQNNINVSSIVTGTIKTLTINVIDGNVEVETCNLDEIKVNGEGIIKLVINDNEEIILEVVNAYNVTNYSELKNRTSVLLNDIKMSLDSTFYLSNATLYGNGFIFDVTDGAYGPADYLSSSYVILLTDATIDNVQIVGKVYTKYGGTRDKEYARTCVLANGNYCIIANSYISNCASPLRAMGGVKLEIINTTLKGGSLCNLDIRANSQIFIDGLTTINQVDGNDVTEYNECCIGLGILVYYDNTEGLEKITIRGNGLTQYNFVNDKQAYYTVDYARTVYNNVFNIDEKFIYTDSSNTKWVNTGILSLRDDVNEESITTPINYAWQDVSLFNVKGHLCTSLATEPIGAPSYIPSSQYPTSPHYSFDYPTNTDTLNYDAKEANDHYYCYWDNKTSKIKIGFSEGEIFKFNPDILNVTKCGWNIIPVFKLDDGIYQDIAEELIIDVEGEHTLTFRYVDEFNYKLSDNELIKYDVIYEKTIKLSIFIAKNVNNATFNFNDYSSITKTINNTTYLMPAAGDVIENEIGSLKINGETIYYPIVFTSYASSTTEPLTKANASTMLATTSNTIIYCPIYDGVITITDYDELNNPIIYDHTTLDLIDGKLSFVESTVYSALRWSSSSTPSIVPVIKNDKLYFQSCSLQGVARQQTTPVIEYIYNDTAGNEYHYFVGYYFPTKEGSSCLASGSLISLSNGTTLPIEKLTKNDLILTWDFNKGLFNEQQIIVLVDHGMSEYEVVNLMFSDGSMLRIIGDHGLFDYDLNHFVYLTKDNVDEFINHRFVKYQNNDNYELITLINAYVTIDLTNAYSITSSYNMNVIVNNLLTVAPPEVFYNWIEMADKLRYDNEKLLNDIEKYGLYTYEDFKDYITYEQFINFNGAYLKIPVEKGYFTFDYILDLIAMYKEWMI